MAVPDPIQEDLRHIERVSVCCRVTVRERYGVWTAVTADLCGHGCRIVTKRLLRPGSVLRLSLSSDLFAEELETFAEVAWSTPELLGVSFVEPRRVRHTISPHAWFERVLTHGAVPGPPTRVLPMLQRPPRGRDGSAYGRPPASEKAALAIAGGIGGRVAASIPAGSARL